MNYYGGAGAAFSIVFVVIAIYFAALFLFAVVFYVLNGFAFMALYRKVGIEPWAAWVPVFNRWRLLELGGQMGWISLLSLVSVGSTVALVFEAIGAYRIGQAFRKDGTWVVLFLFLPFVWAWKLANEKEIWDPAVFAHYGYPPPLVGYGSARGPYVPPQA